LGLIEESGLLSEYWSVVGPSNRANLAYSRQETLYLDEIYNLNDLDELYMTDAKIELDLLFDNAFLIQSKIDAYE
jgi:hypothetical protein